MKINGAKLEMLTAQKGLTFKRLAELSGVTPQSISTIKLRGTCMAKTLVKLANALEVDPADLIETEE